MLPGNLQYWQPCLRNDIQGNEVQGKREMKIVEPIHFAGPAPGAPKTDEDSSHEEETEEVKHEEEQQEEVDYEEIKQ